MQKNSKKRQLIKSNRRKNGKFDILKTFELFNKENINILKDTLIEIILIEADNIFAKNKNLFNLDIKNNKTMQISVFNDKNTYNLLSNTWKRHKEKQSILK